MKKLPHKESQNKNQNSLFGKIYKMKDMIQENG